MGSALKDVAPRALAAVSIAAVVQLYSIFLAHMLAMAEVRLVPFPVVLVVVLLGLGSRTLFAGKESTVIKIILATIAPALAYGLSYYYTFSYAVGVSTALLWVGFWWSLDLGRGGWGDSEARHIFSRGSMLMITALVLMLAPRSVGTIIKGFEPSLYVLLFMGCMLLCLAITRANAVEQYLHVKGSTPAWAQNLIAALLGLVVMLLIGVLLSNNTTLALISKLPTLFGKLGEGLNFLFWPLAYLAHLLYVWGMRLLPSGAGQQGQEGAPLYEAPTENYYDFTASTWVVWFVIVALLLFAIWIVYSTFKRGRVHNQVEINEERESIFSQAVSGLRLALPKLPQWRKTARALPRNPKTVVDLYAYLLAWGGKYVRAKQPHETVGEYQTVIIASLPQPEVELLSNAFEQHKYGASELNQSQWHASLAAWERLKHYVKDLDRPMQEK